MSRLLVEGLWPYAQGSFVLTNYNLQDPYSNGKISVINLQLQLRLICFIPSNLRVRRIGEAVEFVVGGSRRGRRLRCHAAMSALLATRGSR